MRDDVEEIPRSFSGRMTRRKRQFQQLSRWFAQKRHGKKPIDHAVISAPSLEQPMIENVEAEGTAIRTTERIAKRVQKYAPSPFPGINRVPSGHADIESLAFTTTTDVGGDPIIRPEPLHARVSSNESGDLGKTEVETEAQVQPKVEEERIQQQEVQDHPKRTIYQSILLSLSGLMTPVTLGVILSLPFALVQPLKALVVPVEGWSGTKIGNAPDGKAPLGFFFDVRVFFLPDISVNAINLTFSSISSSLFF